MKLLTIIAAAMLVSTAAFATDRHAEKAEDHAAKPAVEPQDPADAHVLDAAKHEQTAKETKKKKAAKPHG